MEKASPLKKYDGTAFHPDSLIGHHHNSFRAGFKLSFTCVFVNVNLSRGFTREMKKFSFSAATGSFGYKADPSLQF